MNVELSFGRLPKRLSRRDERPLEPSFRIGLLGDFTGRANRRICRMADELAAQKPILVDRDNLDDRLRTLEARLDNLLLVPDEQPVSLTFRELDDFHPDRLFEQVGIFSSLRGLRQRLQNPDTSASAIEEIAGLTGDPSFTRLPPPPTSLGDAADVPPVESSGVLDRILEDYSQADRLSAEWSGFDWTGLMREIVAPYAVPSRDPRQPQLLRALDTSISLTMAALLHHPAFRQLEAAWRAVDFLVRRLETGTNLKLFMIDVSQEELQTDLLGTEDLAESGLYRLLVEPTIDTPGGQPWSLLAGNYYFGNRPEEVSVLGRLAKIASAAGAPFMAGSDGSSFGCRQPAVTPDPHQWVPVASDYWQELRNLPEAEYLALLWPRFLLRLPYGPSTCPTDDFDFEEITGTTGQHLLWGQPAFLAATALGHEFAQSGGDVRRGGSREVTDLPVWVYEDRGESEAHPCTELLLSERGIERIDSCGIIPLVAVKDRDVVRIPKFRSIGGPNLAGPWRN